MITIGFKASFLLLYFRVLMYRAEPVAILSNLLYDNRYVFSNRQAPPGAEERTGPSDRIVTE